MRTDQPELPPSSSNRRRVARLTIGRLVSLRNRGSSADGGALRRSSTALVVRIVMLAASGTTSLLLSRFVVGEHGAAYFAAWATVASLPLLIPIGDLGLGAILTNLSARLPSEGADFLAARRRVSRVLWLVSLPAALVAVVVGALGVFDHLLANQLPDVGLAATVSLVLYILAIPASIGARVLIGIRRNVIVLFAQGLITPVTLLLALIGTAVGVTPGIVLVAPTFAYAAIAWALWIASVVWLRPLIAGIVPSRRSPPLRGMAISAAAIGLILPMAFQSHRVILGQASGTASIAAYSAVALVGLPLYAVVQSVGQSLWGEFQSISGDLAAQRRLLGRAYRLFAATAVASSAVLLVFGPLVAGWATAGKVAIPALVYVAFAVLICVQALQLPSGMLMTDADGLRLQAWLSLAYVPVCLAASFAAATALGAAGPLLATAASLAIFLLVPCAVHANRLTRAPVLATTTRESG